ncbi:MAG: Uma2 family endonuclease [Cyanobacteria bacterium J06648_16]
MTAAKVPDQKLSLEGYLAHHDEPDVRYELVHGTLVEMPPPTWLHLLIAKFLVRRLDDAIAQAGKAAEWTALSELGQQTDIASSRLPDVAVVPFNAMENLLASAVLTLPAPLVIEIVSTNWRDDYLTKLAEYEALGVPEYWIVDYQGLGGTRYIGQPKQPTLSIYSLVAGEYQVIRYSQGERVVSPTFPKINLTVNDVFKAGR